MRFTYSDTPEVLSLIANFKSIRISYRDSWNTLVTIYRQHFQEDNAYSFLAVTTPRGHTRSALAFQFHNTWSTFLAEFLALKINVAYKHARAVRFDTSRKTNYEKRILPRGSAYKHYARKINDFFEKIFAIRPVLINHPWNTYYCCRRGVQVRDESRDWLLSTTLSNSQVIHTARHNASRGVLISTDRVLHER